MFKQAQNNKLWNIHRSRILSSKGPSKNDFKGLIRSLCELSDWSFCIFSWWVSKVPTISFWCNLFCRRRQSSDNPYIKDNNSQSHINYEFRNESIFMKLKSFLMVNFLASSKFKRDVKNYYIPPSANEKHEEIRYISLHTENMNMCTKWKFENFSETKSKWNVWNAIKLFSHLLWIQLYFRGEITKTLFRTLCM